MRIAKCWAILCSKIYNTYCTKNHTRTYNIFTLIQDEQLSGNGIEVCAFWTDGKTAVDLSGNDIVRLTASPDMAPTVGRRFQASTQTSSPTRLKIVGRNVEPQYKETQ